MRMLSRNGGSYTRYPFVLRSVSLFTAIFLVFCPGFAQPALAPDDPALLALLSARSAAETAIGQGGHVAAADALIQSLRDCPPDRAELADAAYANGQMASYLFLHVMQEADAYDYLLNRIEPETYVTDKMVKVLCYIAIGLNDEQKTEFSREASYLTSSENLIVRAITRFYLSNPYFYDNESFTNQFAEALGEEFPNLALTQNSLNLSLYAKRENGDFTDLAREIEAKSALPPPWEPWSARLRDRIRQSAALLEAKKEISREAALAPMFEGMEKAEDWRERHFTLLLMKGEFDGPLRDRMCAAARSLAARMENTPDVLQARALLAGARSADCIENPGDTAALEESVAMSEALLADGVGTPTPERVLWETRAYAVQGCAENLAKAGRGEEAINLFTALADALPGSKIADACKAARTELFHHKPQPVNAQ